MMSSFIYNILMSVRCKSSISYRNSRFGWSINSRLLRSKQEKYIDIQQMQVLLVGVHSAQQSNKSLNPQKYNTHYKIVERIWIWD